MIEIPLKEKITNDIISTRNFFKDYYYKRFIEMLPVIIKYNGVSKRFNTYLLEYLLRSNKSVVIGKNYLGEIDVIGTIDNDYSDITSLLDKRIISTKDIDFLDSRNKDIKYRDLEYFSDGNCVCIRNKFISLVSDIALIEQYSEMIGEIFSSRKSSIIQSKIYTILLGNSNIDTDLDSMVNYLFNGQPYISTSSYFDKDNIISVNNSASISTLEGLKKELENIISELLTNLGINAIGQNKESGVSEAELNSNNEQIEASQDIYISPRQRGFDLLNKRFGTKIKVEYSSENIERLTSLERVVKT